MLPRPIAMEWASFLATPLLRTFSFSARLGPQCRENHLEDGAGTERERGGSSSQQVRAAAVAAGPCLSPARGLAMAWRSLDCRDRHRGHP